MEYKKILILMMIRVIIWFVSLDLNLHIFHKLVFLKIRPKSFNVTQSKLVFILFIFLEVKNLIMNFKYHSFQFQVLYIFHQAFLYHIVSQVILSCMIKIIRYFLSLLFFSFQLFFLSLKWYWHLFHIFIVFIIFFVISFSI